MQSEETWMELHVLRRHGWSIAALAREFGLNWRTARRYASADEAPRYRPRTRPADLSAAQAAHVERRLAACPDLRATVLLRELTTEYGYTGSYASLRRRVVGRRHEHVDLHRGMPDCLAAPDCHRRATAHCGPGGHGAPRVVHPDRRDDTSHVQRLAALLLAGRCEAGRRDGPGRRGVLGRDDGCQRARAVQRACADGHRYIQLLKPSGARATELPARDRGPVGRATRTRSWRRRRSLFLRRQGP